MKVKINGRTHILSADKYNRYLDRQTELTHQVKDARLVPTVVCNGRHARTIAEPFINGDTRDRSGKLPVKSVGQVVMESERSISPETALQIARKAKVI